LLQMTYTVPLRRTSLQFSQMRFTLARTFMAHSKPIKGPKVRYSRNYLVYIQPASRQELSINRVTTFDLWPKLVSSCRFG